VQGPVPPQICEVYFYPFSTKYTIEMILGEKGEGSGRQPLLGCGG